MARPTRAQVEAVVRQVVAEAWPTISQDVDHPELPRFDLEIANQIGEIALARAHEMGIAVVYAAADASGDLICLQRMAGSVYAALEVAQSKAFTSASLGVPTYQVADLVQEGGEFFALTATHQGRIIAFAGGMPVFVGGKLVGAIAVSGGSAAQDRELSQYCINQAIGR